MESLQSTSGFFKLPKEIRLMIYEPVLRHTFIKLGNDPVNGKKLAPWPQQPGICRTCRLMRLETVELHYSVAMIQLNIQRPSGEHMVMSWIATIDNSNPTAFNKIRHVSIVSGWGYRDPPKEYQIDMQQCVLLSALRPCVAAYLYNYRGNIRSWSPLLSAALKRRLQQMPPRDQVEFSVARNLREVIATVGELSGYGLDEEAWTQPTISVDRDVSRRQSPLLALPRELRLAVFEFTFMTDTEVVIGERNLRNQLLTDGPPSPGLLRTSSSLRSEALPSYFACTHFILNVQRTLCEDVVLEWITRCSMTYPDAFKYVNIVSVIAGSGISQPPYQYDLLLQKNRALSVINRPTYFAYSLPAHLWSPPLLDSLRQRLEEIPKKGQPGFDAVRNMREVVDVLAKQRYHV